MNITVEKITSEDLMREACDATRHPGQAASSMTLRKAYQCQHSPARTQLFKIHLYDIPSYVSVHLVRHAAVGQQHFVESNRTDRGGSDEVTRLTPVHHMMILNAQHLMDMANVRLCFNADKRTVGAMHRLKNAIRSVDPDLADHMVPQCVRYGFCPELKPCTAGPAAVIRNYKASWFVQQRASVSAELGS